MFDIIGFKALRATKGTAGLHQRYIRGILPAIQHSAAGKGKIATVGGTQMYVPDFSDAIIRYAAISDTVIFFSPDDSFDSFFAIVNSSFLLLQSGFGSHAPYRGAIGWGDIINDPAGIIIGSAVEDAYVGESSQAWAGVMLTSECRAFADSNKYVERYRAVHAEAAKTAATEIHKKNATENGKRLVLYPAPIQSNPKDGPATYSALETYVIDWTMRMYEGASAASFDESTSKHAQTIAANTKQFEGWARKNNR
jgi:hypothetical protein